MKRTLIVLLAVLLAAMPAARFPAASASSDLSVSARSAVVMDADTGRILWARRPDERSLIASTTKIMTAYLVCREGGLDRPVSVPAQAVGVEGSSLYLREGETLTREELLYGTMLHSGNDAALALAIAASGSEAAFVERMNRAARSLGLQNTCYANPHGLDSAANYSTARDLAVLTAHALQNDAFRRVACTKTCTVGERVLTNHNKLLWRCPGCIGVKTGYTKAAGRILVSAAEREGRRVICVSINDPNDWQDHCALLDRAFASYQPRTLAKPGQILAEVSGADAGRLSALAELTVPLLPEETVRMEFVPRFRPIFDSNREDGLVRVWLSDRLLAELPVVRAG